MSQGGGATVAHAREVNVRWHCPGRVDLVPEERPARPLRAAHPVQLRDRQRAALVESPVHATSVVEVGPAEFLVGDLEAVHELRHARRLREEPLGEVVFIVH